MSTEDLLAMLDLPPAPEPADDGPAPTAAAPNVPQSLTALDLDAWSLRRGAEALAGDVLGPILGERAQENQADTEAAAADFLAAAFEPTPVLAPACIDERRGRFMSALLESEEYKALHADTRLDPLASELAAGHFAQGFTGMEGKERAQEAQGASQGTPDAFKQELSALGAAGAALAKASEEVDDLRDAQRAMGCGSGPGDLRSMPLETIRDRFKQIQHSGMLRRIMALAGRYRRLAQARQRQKTIHGRDDVVGVELGNDLGRLCPSELAALADDDLEILALRRYTERAMQQREYRGVEAKGKGPIVVVIDESGSMEGSRIETAKAFALAMGWIARHQKRWLCLAGFSDAGELNVLPIPPGNWDTAALLPMLQHFFYGGTDIDNVLVRLPAQWASLKCPAGKTDMILITDAELAVSDKTRASFTAWKAETQTRLYTIVLDTAAPGDLTEVSDRLWCCKDLSIDSPAITELMKI